MLRKINSVLFCAVLVALSTQAWAQAVDAGYRDFSFLPAGGGGPNTPTGEKPESKLWFNDGFWWGSLYNNMVKGYHIYRFDVSSQSWTDTGTVLDPRSSSRADTLWDGQHLYVASHIFTTNGAPDSSSNNWGRVYRYSYNTQTKVYSLDAGFPVNVTRGIEENLVTLGVSRLAAVNLRNGVGTRTLTGMFETPTSRLAEKLAQSLAFS